MRDLIHYLIRSHDPQLLWCPVSFCSKGIMIPNEIQLLLNDCCYVKCIEIKGIVRVQHSYIFQEVRVIEEAHTTQVKISPQSPYS